MLQHFHAAPRMAPNVCGLSLCCDRKHRSGCGETLKNRGSFCFAPQNAAAAAAAAEKLLSLLSLFLFKVLTRLFI